MSLVALLLTVAASTPLADDSAWARTLARHVDEGRIRDIPLSTVDYSALARGDADFQRAIGDLARAEVEGMSRAERLAFWINAYNVLAVKMVVDHWPLESIREAGGRLLGRVWDKPAGRVAGGVRTLDEIEHEILRPLGEPRIHAAIVCASVSCPDLPSEPFRADRLEDQLDDQMRRFLANPGKGMRLDRSSGQLWLSPIFDWFREDFPDDLIGYLEPYLPESDRGWTSAHRDELSIRYLDYDWGLNATPD